MSSDWQDIYTGNEEVAKQAAEELKQKLKDEAFIKHLKKTEEEVSTWPEWKQKILGGKVKKYDLEYLLTPDFDGDFMFLGTASAMKWAIERSPVVEHIYQRMVKGEISFDDLQAFLQKIITMIEPNVIFGHQSALIAVAIIKARFIRKQASYVKELGEVSDTYYAEIRSTHAACRLILEELRADINKPYERQNHKEAKDAM